MIAFRNQKVGIGLVLNYRSVRIDYAIDETALVALEYAFLVAVVHLDYPFVAFLTGRHNIIYATMIEKQCGRTREIQR